MFLSLILYFLFSLFLSSTRLFFLHLSQFLSLSFSHIQSFSLSCIISFVHSLSLHYLFAASSLSHFLFLSHFLPSAFSDMFNQSRVSFSGKSKHLGLKMLLSIISKIFHPSLASNWWKTLGYKSLRTCLKFAAAFVTPEHNCKQWDIQPRATKILEYLNTALLGNSSYSWYGFESRHCLVI